MAEWDVVVVNGYLENGETARDMIGVAPTCEMEAQSVVTICDDQTEARRVAEAVAAQLGLPKK